MKNSQIILTGHPKGVFLEGIIGDTSLPGTIMGIKPGVATVGGRHTWIASPQVIGNPRPSIVLTEDHLQGKKFSDAYVAGTRCFMYAPLVGEEMNLIVDVPGTGTSPGGNAITIGEFLEIWNNGHLTPAVSLTASLPFIAMEALRDVAAGYEWLWVMRS